MRIRFLAIVSALSLWASCAKAPAKDAGVELEEDIPVEYEGEATSGVIPILEPTEEVIETIDAGEFSVDKRCCSLRFSITDSESALASGAIVGSYGVFSTDGGLPLTRDVDAGEWSANMCHPLQTSVEYWYVFSTPNLSDGGVELTSRYSERELNQSDGMGGFVNIIPSVSDCQGLDAGVGMLP